MLTINGQFGQLGDLGFSFSSITGTIRDLSKTVLSEVKGLVCSSEGQQATSYYAMSQGVPPQATTAGQNAVCNSSSGTVPPYSPPPAPAPMPRVIAITTFDRGRWLRAVPFSSGLSGFGASLPIYRIIASATTKQAGDVIVSKKDYDDATGMTPWYRKPGYWAAIAGGALVLGGGTYLALRR